MVLSAHSWETGGLPNRKTDARTDKAASKYWLRHLGIGVFLFFFLKGIGWLVVAGLAVWGFWG